MDADNRQTVDWSLLSQIVANVPILFYTKDAGEGAYRICNVKFADFCGKERPEDVAGLTPVDLFESDRASKWVQRIPGGLRVLLVNWEDADAELALDLAPFGVNAARARDFWTDKDVAIAGNVIRASLAPHSCLLAEVLA